MFKFDEAKFLQWVEAFNQSIYELAVNVLERLSPVLDDFNKALGWRRLPYETDEVYAERLVSHDWLDNPDARWEYQKIVWLTPVRFVKRLFQR